MFRTKKRAVFTFTCKLKVLCYRKLLPSGASVRKNFVRHSVDEVITNLTGIGVVASFLIVM